MNDAPQAQVPHPLRALWSRYRAYRPRLVLAVTMSVVNRASARAGVAP